MSKLTEGISIQQLIDGGVEFEVQLGDSDAINEQNSDDDIEESLLEQVNMNCLNLQDDDNYVEGEPFDLIAERMDDLIPDGGVKKRVIREGYGETPPDLAVVRVDYNAYIEYEPQPFDSTYSRKRKHEFIINNGDVIQGVDIAVQSMKLTEKAQFLIKPDYGYGAMGCLGRIPKTATILFEIELHEIVDSGAAIKFNKLSEEKKKEFTEVYKYCLSLCARGKEKYNSNIKEAVRQYNLAVSSLERVEMKDYSEQEKQQDLLLRLYSNILVCYTVLQEPKKGCMAFNKINEMTKGTGIKLKAKVYYCNAKCLRMLGDYGRAKEKLKIAQRIEPNNPDIANEFLLLKEDEDKHKKHENEMAKAFTASLSTNTTLQ